MMLKFQTIEDFILLIGTFVAFIAFILWCCFPIVPKESNPPAQYDTQYTKYKKSDSPYDEKMWGVVTSEYLSCRSPGQKSVSLSFFMLDH